MSGGPSQQHYRGIRWLGEQLKGSVPPLIALADYAEPDTGDGGIVTEWPGLTVHDIDNIASPTFDIDGYGGSPFSAPSPPNMKAVRTSSGSNFLSCNGYASAFNTVSTYSNMMVVMALNFTSTASEGVLFQISNSASANNYRELCAVGSGPFDFIYRDSSNASSGSQTMAGGADNAVVRPVIVGLVMFNAFLHVKILNSAGMSTIYGGAGPVGVTPTYTFDRMTFGGSYINSVLARPLSAAYRGIMVCPSLGVGGTHLEAAMYWMRDELHCPVKVYVPFTVNSLFGGNEPSILLHADDVPEADGVAIASWPGRTTHDGTIEGAPVVGDIGGQKAIVLDGADDGIRLDAAVAGFSGSDPSFVLAIAGEMELGAVTRALLSMSIPADPDAPWRMIGIEPGGSLAFMAQDPPDGAFTSESTIEPHTYAPAIVGFSYDGTKFTALELISPTVAEAIGMPDVRELAVDVPHDWDVSAAFTALTIGLLKRDGQEQYPNAIKIRCVFGHGAYSPNYSMLMNILQHMRDNLDCSLVATPEQALFVAAGMVFPNFAIWAADLGAGTATEIADRFGGGTLTASSAAAILSAGYNGRKALHLVDQWLDGSAIIGSHQGGMARTLFLAVWLPELVDTDRAIVNSTSSIGTATSRINHWMFVAWNHQTVLSRNGNLRYGLAPVQGAPILLAFRQDGSSHSVFMRSNGVDSMLVDNPSWIGQSTSVHDFYTIGTRKYGAGPTVTGITNMHLRFAAEYMGRALSNDDVARVFGVMEHQDFYDCPTVASSAPTITSVIGSEPPVVVHADDVPEADGVAITAWVGRALYSGVAVSGPIAKVDGWGGTHKTVNITGNPSYVTFNDAAPLHTNVQTPFTWALASDMGIGSLSRAIIALGNNSGSFPFQFFHVTSGDLGELWSNNGADSRNTSGAVVQENVPSILVVSYTGTHVTIIQRTAALGDVFIVNNVPHAPTGVAAFNTLALGRLDRNVDFGFAPLKVRYFVDAPGVGVSQATAVALLDYIQNYENCPL